MEKGIILFRRGGRLCPPPLRDRTQAGEDRVVLPYNQTPTHPQPTKPFRLPHVERRDTQVPPYGETVPPCVGRGYPKGTGSTNRSCFAVCLWRYVSRQPRRRPPSTSDARHSASTTLRRGGALLRPYPGEIRKKGGAEPLPYNLFAITHLHPRNHQ